MNTTHTNNFYSFVRSETYDDDDVDGDDDGINDRHTEMSLVNLFK